MKKTKKLLSLLLALVMMVGVFAPLTVLANNGNEPALPKTPGEDQEKPASLTSTIDPKNLKDIKDLYDSKETFSTEVNIHKLVSESFGEKFPFKHDGGEIKVEDLTTANGKEVKALPGVEFTYYKVAKPELLDKMVKNPSSYETKEQMEALTKGNNPEVTAPQNNTVTTDEKGVAKVTLTRGYYWFIETKRPSTVTGSVAKSVPFGIAIPVLNKTQDKWLSVVHTYPKNIEKDTTTDKSYRLGKTTEEKAKIDSQALKEWQAAKDAYEADKTNTDKKNALDALEKKYGIDYLNYLKQKSEIDARKGSLVPYDVSTKLNTGQIYTKLHWTDAMTKGLVYNKDLVLKVRVISNSKDPNTPDPNAKDWTNVAAANYTITPRENGFDLEINETAHKAYLDTINKALKTNDVEFKLEYSATVNGETVVDKPENNNITFVPGDNNPGEGIATNSEITITKTWTDDVKNRTTKVTYILEKDGKTVAQAVIDEKGNLTLNAIEGITAEQDTTDKYKVTFKGLKKGESYTIREFVDGYKATYNTAEVAPNQVNITNKPDKTVKTPEPPSVKTYDAKFVKIDGQNKSRLAGAEFYVTRGEGKDMEYLAKADDTELANRVSAYKTAEEAYQKAVARLNELLAKVSLDTNETEEKTKLEGANTVDGSIAKLKDARDAAYKAMKITWKWTKTESEAFVFTSNKDGQIYVEGLAKGSYNLVEKTAPKGFAKRNKPFPFTVGAADTKYDIPFEQEKTDKDALMVENKKITIPQTGGMGTLIFTVVGVALMAGAVIAMKKNREEA